MKFTNFAFLAILATSTTSAFASGPDCITSASLSKFAACADGTEGCNQLCYKGRGAFGYIDGCSFPQKDLPAATQQKIEEVKKILSEAKKKGGGKLTYCLENHYGQGTKYYGPEFKIEEFLDVMIEERDLAKTAAERSKKREEDLARHRKKVEDNTIDLTDAHTGAPAN